MYKQRFYLEFVLFISLCAALAAGCTRSDSEDSSDSSEDADDTFSSDDEDEDGCDWNDEFTAFFSQDTISTIDITFDDEDAWTEIATLKDTELYKSATVVINGESMSNVGVRVKGNSSLSMSGITNTKSLKIDFEQYVDGQRFHCVDKVSLNNSTKDPSMMRESLAYAMASDFGIVSPRTSYADVTVDGELHGLFVMVQQVDKRFLKDKLGTGENGPDDGNLYKLYSEYDFSFIGDDAVPADYGDDDAETGLVLKTNEDDSTMNDYSDVTELVSAIDAVLTSPSDENRAVLESILDVEQYLRFQAWTLCLSNLDAYYSMNHNLYVYSNPVTGQFIMIPWDTNEAYGLFQCQSNSGPGSRSGEDVYSVDLFTPCSAEAPLNKLSYMVPEYKTMYCELLNEFVDVADTANSGLYNSSDQSSRISALNDWISRS